MSFSKEIKKELSEMNNLAKKDEVKYEIMGYLSSDNILESKKAIKYSIYTRFILNILFFFNF